MIRRATRAFALVLTLLMAPVTVLPASVLCVHDDHVAVEAAGATCCGSAQREHPSAATQPSERRLSSSGEDCCTDVPVLEVPTVLRSGTEHGAAPAPTWSLSASSRQLLLAYHDAHHAPLRPPRAAFPSQRLLALRTIVLTC